MKRSEVKEKALDLIVDLIDYVNKAEEGDKLVHLNTFIRLLKDELQRHKVGRSYTIRSK